MTSICYICNGSIGAGPFINLQVDPGSSPVNSSICTTPCGHLFHTYCISRWWRSYENQRRNTCNYNDTTTETAITNPTTTTSPRWCCPLCRNVLASPEVFEVYLSTVDDNDENDKQRELQALKKQVEELKAKKDALHTSLNALAIPRLGNFPVPETRDREAQ